MGASSCTLEREKCGTTSHGARQTVRYARHLTQAHINNLYNTVFWALVQQGGQSEREAHDTLKGTVSADKHEILFSRFGINYDKLPAFFRKGTTLAWAPVHGDERAKPKTELRTLHVDIISDDFWHIPSVNEAAGEPVTDTPYWEAPKRLQGAGLGARIL